MELFIKTKKKFPINRYSTREMEKTLEKSKEFLKSLEDTYPHLRDYSPKPIYQN